MIDFYRDGSKVNVSLSILTDFKRRTFIFSFECGQEWIAELLHGSIWGQWIKAVEKEKKKAYDAGWSDAKKHKPKKMYFTGDIQG